MRCEHEAEVGLGCKAHSQQVATRTAKVQALRECGCLQSSLACRQTRHESVLLAVRQLSACGRTPLEVSRGAAAFTLRASAGSADDLATAAGALSLLRLLPTMLSLLACTE